MLAIGRGTALGALGEHRAVDTAADGVRGAPGREARASPRPAPEPAPGCGDREQRHRSPSARRYQPAALHTSSASLRRLARGGRAPVVVGIAEGEDDRA